MDDLAQKTLHFLFVPEASLAVVFLVIFILMFAAGLMLYFRCKRILTEISESAEEDYRNQRSKMSPSSYVQKKFARLSADEGRLEGLPNNFVSIGIMATFIGLGVAIQGAADLLSAETPDLTKMTEVLAVIAFKFQTSIWGVAFSLIFQFFIINRYLLEKQDLLDEILQKLYEIEGLSSRLLLEQQNELLTTNFALILKSNAEADESRKKESESLLGVATAVNDHLAEYIGATMQFIQSVEAFTEVAKNFDQTTKTLESLVQESGEHYRTAQDTLTQLHAQTIEQLDRNSEMMMMQMESNVEAMRKVFKDSAHDFAKRTQIALQDSVDDTYRKYQNEAQAIAEKYNASARELAEQYRQVAQSMSTSLLNLSEDMVKRTEEARRDIAQKYLAEVQNVREGIEGVKPCIDSLDEYVRQLLVTLAENAKNSTDAANRTQLATQNLSATAENIAANVEKNNREFTEQILTQTKNVEKLIASLETLGSGLAEQQKAQSEMNNALIKQTDENIEHTGEAVTASLKMLAQNQQTAIQTQSQELQKNFAALVSSLQKNQQTTAQTQSQELQKNFAALVSSLQENQQAFLKSLIEQAQQPPEGASKSNMMWTEGESNANDES